MNPTILIADDDKSTLDSTRLSLKYQYNVITADTVTAAQKIIESQHIDVVVTDLDFKGQSLDGLDLINWTITNKSELPVIVVTGDRDVRRVVASQRKILDDFILKPYQTSQLVLAIEKARERSKALNSQERKNRHREVLTQDERIKAVMVTVKKVMESDSDVGICIYGDTGVGKTEIAKYAASVRGGPFMTVDMGAIARDVAEKELFGAKKGSFTGAIEDTVGKFQAANGGVLFLDEIGNASLDIQMKLLRAIQERQVVRLGGTVPEPIDVKIIAATNSNLKDMIKAGTFREDLYYRLEGIALWIPSLRERKADIPLLIGKFLNDMQPKTKPVTISPAALQILEDYAWPGNVRELESTIQSALVLSGFRDIDVEHIPEKIKNPSAAAEEVSNTTAVMNVDLDLERNLQLTEKNLIVKALRLTKGSRKEAMRLLNMSSAKFFRRVKELEIEMKPLRENGSKSAT
jgi:DNA-binding NtrC family response regulator